MLAARFAVLLGGVLSLSVALQQIQAEDKLSVGDKAPDFTLPAASKDTIIFSGVKLSETIGKNLIILAFYPADWSGGCTKEMCTMRDNFGSLAGLGATVFGISGDYVFSHREWAKYHNLPFMLLSDHNHAVAKTYMSFNPSTGHDLRTIYLIDQKGQIAYIDLAFKAGSDESFQHLKTAIQSLQ